MTLICNNLSFNIVEETVIDEFSKDTNVAVLQLRVLPVINGLQLPNIGVFDIVEVLTADSQSANIDLYNCSCGVPGCAGFFDQVHIQVSPTTVTWNFPEEPYRRLLATLIPEQSASLQIVFQREMYLAALSEVRNRLALQFDGKGEQVEIAPGWSTSELAEPSLDALIEYLKNLHEERGLEEAAWADAEGELKNLEFVVQFPNQLKLKLSFSEFAQILLMDCRIEGESNVDIFLSEIKPKLIHNPLEELRAKNPKELTALFHANLLGLSDDMWEQAQYTVATIEQ